MEYNREDHDALHPDQAPTAPAPYAGLAQLRGRWLLIPLALIIIPATLLACLLADLVLWPRRKGC